MKSGFNNTVSPQSTTPTTKMTTIENNNNSRTIESKVQGNTPVNSDSPVSTSNSTNSNKVFSILDNDMDTSESENEETLSAATGVEELEARPDALNGSQSAPFIEVPSRLNLEELAEEQEKEEKENKEQPKKRHVHFAAYNRQYPTFASYYYDRRSKEKRYSDRKIKIIRRQLDELHNELFPDNPIIIEEDDDSESQNWFQGFYRKIFRPRSFEAIHHRSVRSSVFGRPGEEDPVQERQRHARSSVERPTPKSDNPHCPASSSKKKGK